MERSSLLFLAGILLFASCNNNTQTTGTSISSADTTGFREQAQQLNEQLKKMDVPSQLFAAPADKLSFVTGKKGTVVFIAPDDLETENGDRPRQTIVVELKEITNQADLLRANAQTMSDGHLLVSGGSYFLNMTSGGKQLRLKKNKTLKISFPRITDSAMTLFYGVRDSTQQINWQPTQQKLSSKNGYSTDTPEAKSIMVYDTRYYDMIGYVGNGNTYRRDTGKLNALRRIYKRARREERIYRDSVWAELCDFLDSIGKVKYRESQRLNNTLYDITEISKMGWINADKFDKSALSTNITYTIAAQDSIGYARVYLVFKDLVSVISVDYHANDGQTRDFGRLPIGYKARLIAVTYKNGRLLTCSMDMTIAENQHTLIKWNASTEEELNELFKVKG